MDTSQIEELYNEELVLRFFSLYTNHTSIRGSISQHMTEYMKDAISNPEYDYSGKTELFLRLIKILGQLDSSIFRHSNGAFATALYDTIVFGISKYIDIYENASVDILNQKINEVKTDEVLVKFSRKGGNNQKSRIKNRLKEAQRIFGE